LLHLLPYGFLLVGAQAQSSSETTSSANTQSTSSASGTQLTGLSEAATPTGSYQSYTSTITRASDTEVVYGSIYYSVTSVGTENVTITSTIAPDATSAASITLLEGTQSVAFATINSSAASSTSTAAQPINTTPCNGYAEFCDRVYSNITMIAAHNSPFVLVGNAAANQALPVTQQLNDGIRLLQAQAHVVNGTVFLCHTSCDILNAGTLEAYLTTVSTWVARHPFDVVTLLIGNGDYSNVSTYLPAFEGSGITRYVYNPPQMPMGLTSWPTLASMILSSQRVVVFMDYGANQTQIPWIQDEFSSMWETPFDPTDATFPCTQQRPPGLSVADAKGRMYLMNHNLNTEISLLGVSLSVPTTTLLNVTNAATPSLEGSLGNSTARCVQEWDRPPNFLNVDYYNNGSGSVFEVAAKWNGVTYTQTCCGLVPSGATRMRSTLENGGIWIWLLVGSVGLANWLMVG
jgi:hypothetical protein